MKRTKYSHKGLNEKGRKRKKGGRVWEKGRELEKKKWREIGGRERNLERKIGER